MKYLRNLLLLLCCVAVSCGAAPVVELPLTFDRAGIPMIDVALSSQTLRLYLDTGARGLHLPPAVADSIAGLHLTGRKNTSVDLAGKLREDAAFTIPELSMAGMTFHNVTGQYLSPWGLGRAEYELPVVGLDVLLSKKLVIDFPRQRLMLSDEPIDFEARYQAVHTLPLVHADEGLTVAVRVGRQDWPFVLDTGASISIIKAAVNVDASLLAPCAIPLPEGRCEAAAGYIDSGDLAIPLQLIRMPLPERFKPMGIVGADLFSRCALYLAKGSDTLMLSCAEPAGRSPM